LPKKQANASPVPSSGQKKDDNRFQGTQCIVVNYVRKLSLRPFYHTLVRVRDSCFPKGFKNLLRRQGQKLG